MMKVITCSICCAHYQGFTSYYQVQLYMGRLYIRLRCITLLKYFSHLACVCVYMFNMCSSTLGPLLQGHLHEHVCYVLHK